jgi:Ca2+-binding EF-hand superfamily protein
LQEIGQHEKELEDAKVALVRCGDFNLVDGFQTIDALGRAFVTAPQLQNALEDLGLFTHRDDIATFINRYDKDGDGKLVYSDFCDAFTPLDPRFAGMLTQRPADFIHRALAPMYYFTPPTRETWTATWRKIFESEESIELVKQRLARRPRLSPKAAFEYLDAQETGFLSIESLRRVFVNNKYYPSEEDLLLLLARFDKSKNGRVTLAEFVHEIAPKHTVRL